jgi:predicted kinase
MIILRGVHGSGKTKFAAELANRHELGEVIVHSVDDYRKVGGKIIYRPQDTEKAVAECFRGALMSMQAGTPFVVIKNVNSRYYEYAPYILLGKAMDYKVEVIRFDISLEDALERAKGLIPEDKTRELHRRLGEPTYYLDTQVFSNGTDNVFRPRKGRGS